ncbi:hypothetical protein PCASD_17944 [Puccinia coronata f. sp. avenae]|uniref:Uncharacterized protein n=1 Tax=Puccinia coronata f. sp. avenae TaxID=200324 RepID=A0A2N5U3Y8_9BASI|nr:hypothetical protein PCASD_17944 [Puccinia coronata f. sp. avenae]
MPDYPDNESTVFPGNSLAMQLLIISARAHGYDYLRNTLSSLLPKKQERRCTNLVRAAMHLGQTGSLLDRWTNLFKSAPHSCATNKISKLHSSILHTIEVQAREVEKEAIELTHSVTVNQLTEQIKNLRIGLCHLINQSQTKSVPAKSVKTRTFGSRANPSWLGSSKLREHLKPQLHLV